MRRLAILIAPLLLAACGSAASTAAATDAAPETPPSSITALATEAGATRTPEPGFTLVPSTPIPPTATPAPCANDALFVNDITIPDNSQILPGAPIDKRWEIENTGTCDWNRDYRVAFFEGEQMSAAGEHALYPAKAGSKAIVQISMTAPAAPGDYVGRWQLRDPQGRPFGAVLYIKIIVIPLPSPTPSP